jgi:hypothetical protein
VGADAGIDLESSDSDVFYCARHPQVETVLRCGRCDTPICPRCLVQTPVGARCRDCANVRTIPTLDVTPVFLARGIAASLVVGGIVGAIWGVVSGGRGFGFVGFFLIFIAMGIGFCVAEAVSRATNRKRANSLQWIAASGVIFAYLVHNVVAYGAVIVTNDIWGMIAAAFGAFWAYQRIVSN